MNCLIQFTLLASAAAATVYSPPSWSFHARMPYAASDMTATSVDGSVYLVGGCVGNQSYITTDWGGMYSCSAVTDKALVYSPSTDTWVALPPAPRARYRHAAAAVGSKLYVFGGKTLEDSTIKEVDILDLEQLTWSTASSLMESATSDLAAFVLDGMVYAVGGYTEMDYDALTAVHRMDPATEEWTTLPGELVSARGDLGAGVLDGTAYVFGGFTHEDGWSSPHATMEVFDAVTGTWTEFAEPSNVGRGDKAVVPLHSRLLIMGGETKDADGVSLPLKDVEAFHPSSNGGGGWSVAGKLLEERFRFSAAAVGDSAYVFGGQGYLVGEPNTVGSYYPLVDLVTSLSEDILIATTDDNADARLARLEEEIKSLKKEESTLNNAASTPSPQPDHDDHDASATAIAGCVFGVLGFLLGAAALAVATSKGSATRMEKESPQDTFVGKSLSAV